MVCIIRVTEKCPALTLSHPMWVLLVRNIIDHMYSTCWIPMTLNHEQLLYMYFILPETAVILNSRTNSLGFLKTAERLY